MKFAARLTVTALFAAIVAAAPALPLPGISTELHAQALDKSEKMQATRAKLIADLVSRRIFVRHEMPEDVARLWVAPAFYTLDFRDKQQFASVVYAYYFNDTNPRNLVRLVDSRTNKTVGTLTSAGLELN
jgi:hypothetical protein